MIQKFVKKQTKKNPLVSRAFRVESIDIYVALLSIFTRFEYFSVNYSKTKFENYVDPLRDDDAPPMSSYKCMSRPT